MKTDDVLNLDCTSEENKKKLNKFLYNVKPIAKQMGSDKTKQVSIKVLEQTLHGICIKYKYSLQHIMPYYEENKFKFYIASVMNIKETRTWIGNVYGITIWEVLAKTIIKVYSEILKEKEKDE